MIEFNYETKFTIKNETKISDWIRNCILCEGFKLGEINYIFCDDMYLHKLNVEFLNHDTLTDIISFDNTMGKLISGDIFISIERVKENATTFNASFEDELHRVIIHGVLHYLGYKDKNEEDQLAMTIKENESLLLLNS
jgi:probable rRNA maturation factor